jgi:Serine carboxypeptidase
VPAVDPDPYPPMLDPYLHSAAVTSKIGSQSTWVESNLDIYEQFSASGDWMRTSRPNLEAVINASVRTIIYDGDADFIVNYMGVESMVRASRAFSLILYSLCTDLVSAGCRLNHEVLGRVCEAEVRDLYRQR